MKSSLTIVALAITLSSCSKQQQAETFKSTIVNPDGTVTFTYVNPQAHDVKIDVQFAGKNDMTRDTITGYWTATLGPAAPDMYPYNFIVDGITIMDPICDEWFPNEGFKNSLLDIPDLNGPLVHEIQDVPHGEVNYITYFSKTLGCYNNALVYTPPTYNPSDKDKNYPVFYLISGTTDTEEVYYKVGRMNYIADNLIAQGAAKEMIIVLPYGNPAKIRPIGIENKMFVDYFSNDLINDLMPYVESHYNTINDSDNRAIGGFSRGGNQALFNGLNNLDKFSYLCSYSSFTSTDIPNVYDNAEATNSKIHLFWLGVGTDDFLYGSSRDYLEFLDKKGITAVKEFTTDKFGHTWMNAKYFLDHTLRLLFNPEASAQAMANAQPAPAATGNEKPFTPGVLARLFPKPIISPEFDKGAVTFRVKAPDAKQVILRGEMLNANSGNAMQKDSSGIWSITLEGITPDAYCYYFDIDNYIHVCDAQNMYLSPDKGFKSSILLMPGRDFAVNNVNNIDYTPVTVVECAESRYYRCLPANASKNIRLIAPDKATAESWMKIGEANIIMDQLVSRNEASPVNIYMTDNAKPDCNIKFNKTVDANDYNTWAERRKALVEVLRTL